MDIKTNLSRTIRLRSLFHSLIRRLLVHLLNNIFKTVSFDCLNVVFLYGCMKIMERVTSLYAITYAILNSIYT